MLKSLSRRGSSKSSSTKHRHERRRSRHHDLPDTTYHRRHGKHRRREKSRSRSPMVQDPWEKEERVTVHFVNESDDDITFLGMSPANDERSYVNKPGERKVERVKKNEELHRSVKREKK